MEEQSLVKGIQFPQGGQFVLEEARKQAIKKMRNVVEKRKLVHEKQQSGKSCETFHTGQLILLVSNKISSALNAESKKFFSLYEGPFRIKKVLHNDTFVLENPNSLEERGIFNISHIKPFYSRN